MRGVVQLGTRFVVVCQIKLYQFDHNLMVNELIKRLSAVKQSHIAQPVLTVYCLTYMYCDWNRHTQHSTLEPVTPSNLFVSQNRPQLQLQTSLPPVLRCSVQVSLNCTRCMKAATNVQLKR